MSVNADRFRKECRNIFSDDKETRKNARAFVISHKKEMSKISEVSDKCKDNFLNNSEINTSSCEIVSYAINQFVKKDDFIFAINDNKAGQIGSLKGKVKKIRSSGAHENLPVKSDEPTYVVTMPHHAGNASLDNQIKLLFEESFGLTTEESVKQAKKRMHLFIGVNYCHSINHEVNKKKKKYITDLLKKPSELNVSYEAFSWSPFWRFEGKNISQTTVKRLFRLLQEIDSEKASIIYKEVMSKSHKIIPFQDIREEIIDCKLLSSYFSHFRKDRTDRPCYLLIADDDAAHLRTEGVGLLSHYDKLIKKNPKLKVATTGYFMSDGKRNSVEIITKIFLVARHAHPRPNATYLPEPNVVVKIPANKNISESTSFLRAKSGKLESIGLLEFKGLMEGDTNGQVVIGKFGPIQTGVSPNIKDCSKFKSKPEDFLQWDTLRRLISFSQSPVNSRSFAQNIIRTIPNPAWPKGTKITSVYSEVRKIYTAFDIIEYARDLHSIWYKAYLKIANEIRELSDLDVAGDDPMIKLGAKSIGKKLHLDKKDIKLIEQFVGKKVVNVSDARKKMLKTFKYKETDVTMIFQSSIKINKEIYLHLKNNVINK